jgi:hypothetical protein
MQYFSIKPSEMIGSLWRNHSMRRADRFTKKPVHHAVSGGFCANRPISCGPWEALKTEIQTLKFEIIGLKAFSMQKV